MTLAAQAPAPSFETLVDTLANALSQVKGVGMTAEQITRDTGLWADSDSGQPSLSLDSIDFLELVLFLEEEHGWVIPEAAIDVQDCRTVGDVATLVLEHVHGATP